jgi:hypothetical protein
MEDGGGGVRANDRMDGPCLLAWYYTGTGVEFDWDDTAGCTPHAHSPIKLRPGTVCCAELDLCDCLNGCLKATHPSCFLVYGLRKR